MVGCAFTFVPGDRPGFEALDGEWTCPHERYGEADFEGPSFDGDASFEGSRFEMRVDLASPRDAACRGGTDDATPRRRRSGTPRNHYG